MELERLFYSTEGVGSRRASLDVESGLVVSLCSDSLRMQACLRCTTRWRNLAVRIYPGSRLSPSWSCMECVVVGWQCGFVLDTHQWV